MVKNIFILLLITLNLLSSAFAGNAAMVNIKISGAFKKNQYFLCLKNVGCLSLLAAQKGRIYSIMHPIEMGSMYILDVGSFHIINQGFPRSCHGTVGINKTVTITGKINGSENLHIDDLNCSIV